MAANQRAAATASFMIVLASLAPEKYTEVAVIQKAPLNACTIPVPPEVEKYAASPNPLTEDPLLAASFAAEKAVGPGCAMVTSRVSPLV